MDREIKDLSTEGQNKQMESNQNHFERVPPLVQQYMGQKF